MPDSGSYASQKGRFGRAFRFACLLLATAAPWGRPLLATSVIPISDAELSQRADVIVHGIVVSSEVTVDELGRPETLTIIEPLSVLKGQVSGSLVLHQLGGTLPDGRFFKVWGRPEYQPGHEVVVFALAHPGGEYETAELLLGKFEVQKDDAGQMFAVPSLAAGTPSGVTVARPRAKDGPAENDGPLADFVAPRDLEEFLRTIRRPAVQAPATLAEPRGKLRSVVHQEYANRALRPEWVTNGLWRWNNGASAAFTLAGLANITGGGIAEASNATATWSAEPNSTIAYSVGSNTANPIHMDALSSPCGWTTCLSGAGVIGCGGFGGGGTNVWRGETYVTITSGEVWLRSFCNFNGWDPTTTQSVLTHELGHTLGLGHSDQGASPHDICVGDEGAAIMRSIVQSRTTLGTDDQDGVRWLYGDGGNSCGAGGAAPTAATSAASGIAQAAATLNGTVNPNGVSTMTYFQYGTTSSYGTATGQQGVGSGTSAVPISASLSGLACGRLYHFRAVGTNADGTGSGSDMTFTTSACPPPPVAATNTASGIGQNSATFAGSVNPNGMSTTAYFQYGTTTSYGDTTAPQSEGSGTNSLTVSQAVFGLMCNALYHFRIVATSSAGTSVGSDQTLTTSACTSSAFYTLTPCRVADTRDPTGPLAGPAMAAGGDRTFSVTGVCGIPSTAKVLSANVTATQGTAAGDLRLYAAGAAQPPTSSINFRAVQTRANSAKIPLGAGGGFAVHSDQGSGTVQVIIDVNGYFQ